MVLICLIFLTDCRTNTVYVYPHFIHPEIEVIPTKTYVDGGFKPVENGQFISTEDAKILGNYIINLKKWGSAGWTWVTDYYITELNKLVDNIPKGDN